MKRMAMSVALLAALTMLAPLQVDGQRGQRGRRGPADVMRGQGVEAIMRLREQLELNESQIQELDQIRQEAVQRRTAHQAEMEELHSQVRAGQLERAALRQAVEARQEVAQAIREQQQERIEAILSDTQKAELEDMRGRARAFERGRRVGMRRGEARPGGGRAFRGQRGFRGGDGFAPDMRRRNRFDRRPGIGRRGPPSDEAPFEPSS
jgi:Spy/CpxP family protein refolding chaperone